MDIGGMLRHGEDKRERYNGTAKFSVKLNKWARFTYTGRYTHTDTQVPTNFGESWYEYIGHQTWPNLALYDANGYYYSNGGINVAMRLALGGDRKVARDENYHQVGLILEPVKNWFIRGEFNYSMNRSETKSLGLPTYDHDVNGEVLDYNWDTTLYEYAFKDKYINWNVYTDYSFSIADAHNFKVMAGMQTEDYNQHWISGYAFGLQDVNMPEFNLSTNLHGNGTEKAPQLKGASNSWSILGYFGRLNYDYKGRYLFEANIRFDGSSRFRKGKRWTGSPSFSAGWNIAQENFWEPVLPVVSLLKLRASYGQLSNQLTENWYPTYRTMTFKTQNGSWLDNGKHPDIAYVNGLVSSALTWEKVKTWNIGLDWGLFNNRLSGSFDAFIRDTDDMVGPPVELPNTLGLKAPVYNNCSLRSKGWELQLTWRDVTSFGLAYSISANVSDATTKVRSYPGNPTLNLSQILPGQVLGDIWGQESYGIARSEEEMQAHLAALDRRFEEVNGYAPYEAGSGQNWYDGNTEDWHAGDMMYKDYNGDGQITWGDWTYENPGDMHVIGNTTPRYFFGLDINAQYKGFDIRAFFQGVGKRDFFSRSRNFWGAEIGGWWRTAALQECMDFFHAEDIVFDYTDINGNPAQYVIPANTDAYYPRPLFSAKNQEYSTTYMQNAAYLRCKNLQLGYTLPVNITNKFGVSNLRFYVSVDNLFTITGLSKLFDPETVGGGSWNGRTYDGNSYPLARTWSFGLSISM